ncbi:MAG: hypothetical protein WCO13_09735, partial [Bacteroidota bacterium]
ILVTTVGGTATSTGFTFITCTSPFINSQSIASQSTCINSAFSSISVTATGDGISYQWFYNTSSNNTTGLTLHSANGANTHSYTPQSGAAGTLYYYCVVSGSCGTVTSTVSNAFITNALPTVGTTVSPTATVCYGTSVTVGGTGATSYSWNGGLANATPFTATSTATYTVTGTDNNACSNTATLTITVNTLFTAGNINTTGETMCYNQNPNQIGSVTAASGGNNVITYEWYSSTDGFINSILIASNTATYYPPSGLTQTTSYRRYAHDGSCNTYFELSTGEWTVTVGSLPSASISGPTSICKHSTTNVYTTESGMTSYIWTVNGGTITAGSATNAITVTWNTEGSQTVSVNYSNASGCSAATATTFDVTVKSAPTPVITGSPNNTYYVHALDHITYCTPLVTGHLYSWSAFGSITYPSVNRNCIDDYLCNPCGAYGTYTISVSETDPTTGCSVTARKNIYIQTTP